MQSTIPIQLGTTEGIRDLPRTVAGKAFLAVGATAFVALCAHISVPLYFTPVPLTLQTLAVILIGLTLSCSSTLKPSPRTKASVPIATRVASMIPAIPFP